jgi:hypothetical protein
VTALAKTVSLPLRVYEDLNSVSEELSLMAKKPISASMAVDLLMEIYRAHLSNPCALDMFSQQMQSLNLMSPQEFDSYWDENIEGKHKRRGHQAKPKSKV